MQQFVFQSRWHKW